LKYQSLRRILLLALLFSVVILLIQWRRIRIAYHQYEPLNVGQKACLFETEDINKNVIKLNNESTLLLFFNPSCIICGESVHIWKHVYDICKGKNIHYYGIVRSDKKSVIRFLKRHNLRMPVIIDYTGQIFRKYHVINEPIFVFIKNGKIVYYENDKHKHDKIINYME